MKFHYSNTIDFQFVKIVSRSGPCHLGRINFFSLARSATLIKFVTYMEKTWITSSMWPPEAWSVYMLEVKTNNDIQGWHTKLNTKVCGNSLNLYQVQLFNYWVLRHRHQARLHLLPRQVRSQCIVFSLKIQFEPTFEMDSESVSGVSDQQVKEASKAFRPKLKSKVDLLSHNTLNIFIVYCRPHWSWFRANWKLVVT